MMLTYKQVAESIEPFTKFTNKELPFALALSLKPLGRRLAEANKDYGETRDAIAQKYGERVEGDTFRVSPEGVAELIALTEHITDIEPPDKISWEVAEPLFPTATASDFALDWLIEFPEESDIA